LADGSSKQLPIAKVQMDVGKMSGYYAFVTTLATFLLEVRFSMRLILKMVTAKLHYFTLPGVIQM
jgi:hypothetical protein